MSTIRKFGPLFNALSVLRAVFAMVLTLSARSGPGFRAGLPKCATVWALGSGGLRALPPGAGRSDAQERAPACGAWPLRRPGLFHVAARRRRSGNSETVLHQAPRRGPMSISASHPRTRTLDRRLLQVSDPALGCTRRRVVGVLYCTPLRDRRHPRPSRFAVGTE